MDIQHLLECILSVDSSSLSSKITKYGLREQKGGVLGAIAYIIKHILVLVFEYILLPLVQMLFQLPSFFKEVNGEDENGNPIMKKKLRTVFKIIPWPKYTPELDGTGYLWRYLWFCLKFTIGIIIGLLGGIYLVLAGMVYLVVKILKDFTEKPRTISKKYEAVVSKK